MSSYLPARTKAQGTSRAPQLKQQVWSRPSPQQDPRKGLEKQRRHTAGVPGTWVCILAPRLSHCATLRSLLTVPASVSPSVPHRGSAMLCSTLEPPLRVGCNGWKGRSAPGTEPRAEGGWASPRGGPRQPRGRGGVGKAGRGGLTWAAAGPRWSSEGVSHKEPPGRPDWKGERLRPRDLAGGRAAAAGLQWGQGSTSGGQRAG